MQEEAIYRCVNPACARLMPRPVKFCPWCGTAQAGAQPPGLAPAPSLDKPDEERSRGTAASADEAAAELRRATEAAAAASAAAALSGWSDAPAPPLPAAATPSGTDAHADADGAQADREAAAGTAAARAGLAGGRAGAGVRADVRPGVRADARPRGGLFGTAFGHGARTRAEPAQQAGQEVPRPPIPPRPARPQRAPIRLRYWLFVLVILWAVWLLARPNAGRKIEQRIDHAVALAGQCKAKEAQDELIALRKTRATPAQLEQLQASLNEGAAACTRKRQKEKAWGEASAAAESALGAGNPERAGARLQVYTRRYGEDDRARALRQRIDDARHPLAAPSP